MHLELIVMLLIEEGFVNDLENELNRQLNVISDLHNLLVVSEYYVEYFELFFIVLSLCDLGI